MPPALTSFIVPLWSYLPHIATNSFPISQGRAVHPLTFSVPSRLESVQHRTSRGRDTACWSPVALRCPQSRPELACGYVALLAARSSDDVATGDTPTPTKHACHGSLSVSLRTRKLLPSGCGCKFTTVRDMYHSPKTRHCVSSSAAGAWVKTRTMLCRRGRRATVRLTAQCSTVRTPCHSA